MSKNKLESYKRQVTLGGMRPLMFDRYPGDNESSLQPSQRMYLNSKMEMIMPSANILSFLCAENTKSAVKFFYDKRKYKDVAQALLSFVLIEPLDVPITRDGKTPIVFTDFKPGEIEIHHSVARLPKGIPNIKDRPLLFLPWQITFQITIYKNEWFDEESLRNLFERGGLMIGLGTFRGVYGKFTITEWKKID